MDTPITRAITYAIMAVLLTCYFWPSFKTYLFGWKDCQGNSLPGLLSVFHIFRPAWRRILTWPPMTNVNRRLRRVMTKSKGIDIGKR